MTIDYDFALWGQQTDKQIARGLIASDGSEIKWNDTPLSELKTDQLRAIYEIVRNPPDTGFETITRMYREANRAVQLELKFRGVDLHSLYVVKAQS